MSTLCSPRRGSSWTSHGTTRDVIRAVGLLANSYYIDATLTINVALATDRPGCAQ